MNKEEPIQVSAFPERMLPEPEMLHNLDDPGYMMGLQLREAELRSNPFDKYIVSKNDGLGNKYYSTNVIQGRK